MLNTSDEISIDVRKQCNKIVCVDRDKQAVRELTATLESLKYHVAACASDAFEAVRMVTMHNPDILMLEVSLQERFDGIALARYLRDNFRMAIVFVTEDVKTDTLERVLLLQPQGFLNKPYRPLDVRNVLAIACQYNSMRQQSTNNTQEGCVQGRLEKIGGTLPALQLVATLTAHGKLVFDDGAAIIISNQNVIAVQHASEVVNNAHDAQRVLSNIIRRQTGHFCVEVLDKLPASLLKISVDGLLLQHHVDTDEVTRALHDFQTLSLEAVDPYKHPSQFKESDSLLIETLNNNDDFHLS